MERRPAASPAAAGLADLLVYLHAFRRHWLVSLGIGLAGAIVAGATVWLLIGEKYLASAYLRVDMQEQTVLGTVSQMDRDRFEIFKNTQQNQMMSRLVLMAAWRKPDVTKIARLQDEPDPVGWLQKYLSVGFPLKGEYMQVSVALPDPHEAAVLVNSVVDSYLTDVVKAERDQRQQRLNKLESACAEKEQQIRNTRQELRNLALSYGIGADSEAVSERQKLIIGEYGLYRQALAKMEFDLGELQAQLASQQAMLQNTDSMDVPAELVDAMVNADPVAKTQSMELAMKKQEQILTDAAVSPGSKNRYVDRYSRELKKLQDAFDLKVEEIKKKLRDRSHNQLASDVLRLQRQLDVKQKQYGELEKHVKQLKDEASKFGSSTVDIEMLRADLKQSEMVYSSLNNEREKVKVELSSAPRIALMEKAEDPLVPSNRLQRLMMTAMAMLVAFCCPAVALVVWDVRSGRINTASDVSQRLRLPVIGSVPLIPARVIRQLDSPSKRHQSWQMRLTESVDGITARVLHKAEIGQCRVIMVSSATGGEGKTTLATQLATSLARTKRRVVLVDFDLRRPAFNGVFGVPLEPGVCELLRHQNTVAELVHPSGTENLDVITAGRWDRQALASLSNGCAGAMFQELRDAYDFVVIDTSPLLPVADARFVSQHVDAVVLSVLRDVSQAPKIQAACEILAAFGVSSVEAVVTGAAHNVYGRHDGSESTISA